MENNEENKSRFEQWLYGEKYQWINYILALILIAIILSWF